MHAQIRVMEGHTTGRVHVLRCAQTFVIGRGQDCTIRIHDSAVSRRHAQLELRPTGELFVTDLGSANGSFLQGRQLVANKPERVFSGDAVTIGASILTANVRSHDEGTRVQQIKALGRQAVPPEDYEILGALGEGGHGRVYAARQKKLDRLVAIKVLTSSNRTGDEEFQRFVREGQACARLESPHIVKVHTLTATENGVFLVMELVNGPNALDRLQAGPLALQEALEIGEHVAAGLEVAHEAGVVHRDIKPANILISPEGIAKLGDFGVAKDLSGAGQELTQSNLGLGSLPYVSPEQATNAKHVGPSSDIYSLGATLYHLIGGRPPFKVDGPHVLMRIVEKPPEPLTDLRPDCPADVARLVHGMLEKDPAARPANASSVLRQLSELLQLHFPTVESRFLEREPRRETVKLPRDFYKDEEPPPTE